MTKTPKPYKYDTLDRQGWEDFRRLIREGRTPYQAMPEALELMRARHAEKRGRI